MLRIAALVLVIGASLAAGPAAAQFGNIFGNQAPPRPPGGRSQWRVPGAAACAGPIPRSTAIPTAAASPAAFGRTAAVRYPGAAAAAAPRRYGRAARRRQRARVRPPPANRAAAGQSTASATCRYRSAVGRYGRHRDADAEDRQRPRGVFRPRQDHRPHHFVRCGDRRNRAIRRAAGHRAGLLHAPADRGDEYRRLRRRRRGDAARARSSASSPAGCSRRARACMRSSIRSTTSG